MKINEFNNVTPILTPDDILTLTDLIDLLEATSRYHVSQPSKNQLTVISKLLSREWPISQLFPAYDILRILVTHIQGSKLLASLPIGRDILQHVSSVIIMTDAPVATMLCALRFIGNSFRYDDMRRFLLTNLPLDTLIVGLLYLSRVSYTNKPVKLAAVNILMNLSIALKLSEAQTLPLSLPLQVSLASSPFRLFSLYIIIALIPLQYLFLYLYSSS